MNGINRQVFQQKAAVPTDETILLSILTFNSKEDTH
jgi:hypothetical protein